MLNDKITKLSEDIAKAKEEWIIGTLLKHDLIYNSNVTLQDIEFLKEALKFKIINEPKVTKIFLEEELLGEWLEDYETEFKDGIFSIKTHYWN